jgi:hypothetical protein
VAPRLNYPDLSGHWAKVPVLRVAALGILTGKGDRFRPQALLTREEALAALLALAEAGGNEATFLDRAERAGLITREERARLEGKLSAPAERQEVAAWLARASGLSEAVGAGNLRLAAFADAGQVRPEYRGWLEALLEKGWLAGRGRLMAPTTGVTRAEAASLLYRALPEALARRGWRVVEGLIVAREEVRSPQGLTLVYQVLSAQGERVELVAGPGAGTPSGLDWIAIVGGRVATAGLLASGRAVRVWINPPVVVLVEVVADQAQKRTGTLEAVNPSRGEITVVVAGRRTVLAVHPAARVTVAGRSARLSDLLPGQEVDLSLRAGVVEEVAAALPPAELPAYGEPSVRVFSGYLVGRAGEELRVMLADGREETWRVSSVTSIVSGNRTIRAADLRSGELVRLTVSESPSRVLYKVEAAREYPREEVWCGRLARVQVQDRVLLVSQPRRQYYGRWLAQEGQRSFSLAPEARLYLGQRPATLEELAGEVGGQVFLVTGRAFGREEVGWLVVQEGEPWIYQDRLAGWNPAQREMALASGTRLAVSEAARVLQGRRAVDPSELENGRPVLAVAAGRAALFVEQPEYYPSSWAFYCGVLRRLDERSLALYAWRRYDGDYWSNAAYQEKELALSPVLVVLDGTKETPQFLDLFSFLESRYTGAYLGQQVCLVADGAGKVIALAVRKEGRGPEVTCLGTVEAVMPGGQRRFSEVLAWSPEYRAWRELRAPLTVDVSRALVFRYGEWVGPAGLTSGNLAYLIHDYQEALIAFIQ